MSMIVRAVDVGYGNTKYVIGADNRKATCRHFPSSAPVATKGELADALGSRRKTVEIEIEGLRYEVGQDVLLAHSSFTSRNMDDDYCGTPEYLALVRGALHNMEIEAIDLLVVGLPVSTFAARKQSLERKLTGIHPVGGRRTVEVRRVRVLAQPHGALVYYSVTGGKGGTLKQQRNLIIDCGARTFDYLVAQGLKAVEKRSGAVNRGMLDVLTILAERVSKDMQTRFDDLDRIDRALRGKTHFMVFGDEYDLAPHLPSAQKVAQEAVTEMRRQIQDGSDIDNIIVAGGGAFFFKPMIAAAFPRHHICELQDSMYANVRGFQFAGMGLVEQREARARAAEPTTQEA